MTIFPSHPVSRIVAALWLLACVVLFVLALLQRDLYANERAALAIMVPVYFLSFPLGHLAIVANIQFKLALYLHSGAEPGILSECLYLWTFMVVLGYVQWFILLPWLSRKCWQLCGVLFNRGAAPNRARARAD